MIRIDLDKELASYTKKRDTLTKKFAARIGTAISSLTTEIKNATNAISDLEKKRSNDEVEKKKAEQLLTNLKY